MLIFIIECIVLCVLFTIGVAVGMKDPINGIHDYPPAIIQRVRELGLISDQQIPRSKKVIAKKLLAAIICAVILAVCLKFVNNADTFWRGFLISYGLWSVVDWYDAIVLDCLWCCHDKHFIIPGTEDMVADYHDYWFHIKKSAIGMLIGLPVCLLAGLFCGIGG